MSNVKIRRGWKGPTNFTLCSTATADFNTFALVCVFNALAVFYCTVIKLLFFFQYWYSVQRTASETSGGGGERKAENGERRNTDLGSRIVDGTCTVIICSLLILSASTEKSENCKDP